MYNWREYYATISFTSVNRNLQGNQCYLEYKLKCSVRDCLDQYFKWKFINVGDFLLCRPYLRINEKKVAIMPLIMEVENNYTETSFNYQEKNSNEETMPATNYQTI